MDSIVRSEEKRGALRPGGTASVSAQISWSHAIGPTKYGVTMLCDPFERDQSI
jgi:hypothetical protein